MLWGPSAITKKNKNKMNSGHPIVQERNEASTCLEPDQSRSIIRHPLEAATNYKSRRHSYFSQAASVHIEILCTWTRSPMPLALKCELFSTLHWRSQIDVASIPPSRISIMITWQESLWHSCLTQENAELLGGKIIRSRGLHSPSSG